MSTSPGVPFYSPRSRAGWLARQALVGAGLILLVVGLVWWSHWAGVKWHDNPKEYFEENSPHTWVNTAMLIGVGVVCWVIRNCLRARGDGFSRFWTAAAIIFALTGLDDGLKIHEFLDHSFHDLAGLPRTNPATTDLDDWIMLLYPLAFGIAVLWHWRRLVWEWALMGWWVVAGVIFVAMVGVDTMGYARWAVERTGSGAWLEEGLKLLSAATFLVGALSYYWKLPPAAAA